MIPWPPQWDDDEDTGEAAEARAVLLASWTPGDDDDNETSEP